jgi:hypothetical protein
VIERPPHEPTATVKPASLHHGDAPPPSPPHELPRTGASDRRFEHGGRAWLARLAGKGACGTGSYGLGLVEAIHFHDAADPNRPLREALLARGRFESLFDDELVRLLTDAVPIVTPEEAKRSGEASP